MLTTTKPLVATAPLYAVLPASDITRARTFYHDTLGLEIEELPGVSDSFLAHAGGGTRFLVYTRAPVHTEHTQAAFVVSDVLAAVHELKDRGVVFEEYDMPGLKTVDSIATSGASRSAWFRDTEGNILSVSEMAA